MPRCAPEEGAARFAGEAESYIYARMGDPTSASLRRPWVSARAAATALATSVGMAAVFTVYLGLLWAGDVVCGDSGLRPVVRGVCCVLPSADNMDRRCGHVIVK
jgi:O-acetylhomoserine/O-acetylserine sulfhydrylase-like pyridoxal-dependent enzyme